MDPCERKRTNPTPVDHQYKKIKVDKNNVRPILELPVLDFSKHTSQNTLLKSILSEKVFERDTNDKLNTLVNETFDEKSDFDLFLKSNEESTKIIPEKLFEKQSDMVYLDLSISDDDVSKDEKIRQNRKSVLIPPLKLNSKSVNKTNRCKYIFKKKPKTGMQCTLLTKHELCTLHLNQKKENCESKKKGVINLTDENQRLIERIGILEKNLSEMSVKIGATEVKNNKLEEKVNQLEDYCKESDSKFNKIIEILSQNQTHHRLDTLISMIKDFESKAPPATVKIQNLNNLHQYTLVKKLVNNYAIISNQEKSVRVKFPTNMVIPEESAGNVLKYNKKNNIFEWTQGNE